MCPVKFNEKDYFRVERRSEDETVEPAGKEIDQELRNNIPEDVMIVFPGTFVQNKESPNGGSRVEGDNLPRDNAEESCWNEVHNKKRNARRWGPGGPSGRGGRGGRGGYGGRSFVRAGTSFKEVTSSVIIGQGIIGDEGTNYKDKGKATVQGGELEYLGAMEEEDEDG